MHLIKEYLITDPTKKDEAWASKIVSELRRFMKPLVDYTKAEQNMQYLLGVEDKKYITDMFKEGGKNSKLSFITLSVVEKYRNILIAERDKAGVDLGLRTVDASVLDKEKKHDVDMLKYKKTREAIISSLNARIGEPEFNVDKSYFKGNIDSFEDMGLDSEDDDNLNYFFASNWRLLQEVFGEVLLTSIVSHNRLKQKLEFLLNDILAKKAIAMRVFVSQQTGELKMDYVAPENVRLIPGSTQEHLDSPAIEIVKHATVSQIIHELGKEFDPVNDYEFFINSINHHHGKTFTGIYDNNSSSYVWCKDGKMPEVKSSNCIDNYSFMNFRLPLHYIELKSTDSTYFKSGKSVYGNNKMFNLKKDAELKTEMYAKKVFSNEVTYRCHYIPSSALTQRIFKFGKLFHQTIKGGEDERSNYSICIYQGLGPSAIDIMKPYIIMINKAWAKFEWFVQRAKPDGRTYNYEALAQVASKMIKEGDAATKITKLIKIFEEGINDIYTIPTVDGERVGGGQNPYFNKENGLAKSAKDFLDTIVFCNEKLSSDFGLSPLREAYSPSPNDGYKLNMEALKQSRNATEYMSIMLLNMFDHVGTQALLITQDIIKHKTSLAYNFLTSLCGEDTMKGLERCDYAHHRMGIYVDSFNRDFEKAEIKQAAQIAYSSKEITFEQYLLVISIGVASKAAMTLAYEKRRLEKLKAKETEQAYKNQAALKEQESAAEVNLIVTEKNLENEGKRIEGGFKIKVAEIMTNGNLEKKKLDLEHQTEKKNQKSEEKKDQQREKNNLAAEAAI